MVFESGVPITMVPLDVSHTVLATPEVIKRVHALGSNYSTLLVELLNFFTKSYKETFGFDYPPLHGVFVPWQFGFFVIYEYFSPQTRSRLRG